MKKTMYIIGTAILVWLFASWLAIGFGFAIPANAFNLVFDYPETRQEFAEVAYTSDNCTVLVTDDGHQWAVTSNVLPLNTNWVLTFNTQGTEDKEDDSIIDIQRA